MIHIKNLVLTFGSQKVFDAISCTIDQHARMGLVGCNGSGKSTLLKILAGQQSYESGNVTVLPGKRIAYMPQEVILASEKNVLEETIGAIADIKGIQKEIDDLQHEIDNGNTQDHIINRYVHLHEHLIALEPETLQLQATEILKGLGFTQEQLTQSVQTLSVGWKMRIVLAKLLLQKADFYLFDEPTNHLDIIAKDWFIAFLKKASFGFLLVCHERYFLDMLCSNILALEQGKAKLYKGNYTDFELQYEHGKQELEAAYQLQQKEIARKQDTIARFKAKASKAKMAKSMQKKLDAIDRISIASGPKQVHFSLKPIERSGRIVLSVEHLAHHFGQKKIFSDVHIVIERGDRVALVAANGVGKTTLFNLIVGNIPAQKGSITFGRNVSHAICAQDQKDSLDFNKSILENAQEQCPKISEQQIRSCLGAFLFSGQDIQKKIKVLSGGEKNRVAMAIVLMQGSNFLLLDEPTNHLDMPSKEILLKALQSFEGTIFFVSHDHDFINHLATCVIALTPNGAHNYIGNYTSYLHQEELIDKAATVKPVHSDKDKQNDVKQTHTTKHMKSLEYKIDQCEKEIEKLSASFADVVYGNPEFERLEQKIQKKKDDLQLLMKEWEQQQS